MKPNGMAVLGTGVSARILLEPGIGVPISWRDSNGVLVVEDQRRLVNLLGEQELSVLYGGVRPYMQRGALMRCVRTPTT